MAGLDEALRRYNFIDPDRLGVMGGSYGGFMTSWIVGHMARFKAACSERAVNNQASMFDTSDIGHYIEEWQKRCLPWEDPQWYAERSPISYAKEITTPLLILHAEADLRCPVEQPEQLFVALKKLRERSSSCASRTRTTTVPGRASRHTGWSVSVSFSSGSANTCILKQRR